MRRKEYPDLKDIIEDDVVSELIEKRTSERLEAKRNILKLQDESRKSLDKKRIPERNYKIGDLVLIKRTQYGVGLKLNAKILGPYKVKKLLKHGRYEVEKVDESEGPNKTTTVAEYMKPWRHCAE